MPPLDVNSLFSRAEQAYVEGRLDAARSDLIEVQRLVAPNSAVLHLFGMVERKRGNSGGARAAFEAALKMAPRDPQIRNNFANLLADIGEFEAALGELGRILDSAPGFHEARYNRALLLQKLGRMGEALAELEQIISVSPTDAKAHSAKGTVLRHLGRLADAADAYDKALAHEPRRLVALHGRARAALERGESSAPDLFRRALDAAPQNLELHLGLAEALEAEGSSEAIPQLAAVVAAHPQWQEGQKALARIRWEAGEGRAFTRDLQRALDAHSRDRNLWLTYASALADAHLPLEAADVAAKARSFIGDDPALVLLEALHASEAGLLDRADRLFAAAPEGLPGRSVVEARHRLRSGDHERAGRLLDAVRAEQPWDVTAWALTGLLWRLMGDSRASWLLETPGLVNASFLPLRPDQLEDLTELLRTIHRTRAHPIGQSLRGGTQTRGRLFERQEPEIQLLRAAIEDALSTYWEHLPPVDPEHPLLRHRPRHPRLAGAWSVRLTDGGFHVPHCHPEGILSSACYFVVPEAKLPMEGFLELGGAPAELNLALEPLAHVEPSPGKIVLFPSYLFHGTRSFAEGERLTVAFDVSI